MYRLCSLIFCWLLAFLTMVLYNLYAVLFLVAASHAFYQRSYDPATKTMYIKTDQDEIRMIVMGDWGGLPFWPYFSPFEKATAGQIMKVAAQEKSQFLLALGDNFYFNGVENEYDSRFQKTFENVFNNADFLDVPWYVLAGNHDHYGNVTGQIAYSKHSSRWMFPNLWYSIELSQPTVNMTIVMIDTVTLCGNTHPTERGSQPTGTENPWSAQDQLEFIEGKLQNNDNAYVIVAGHFPVWSVAEHGPTQCLIDKLKPLLEKYNVNAYFSGHDHNLQHIRENNSMVNYFVSGAVDVVDPSTTHISNIPDDSLQYHWGNILGLGGFATLDADGEQMTLRYYSAMGSGLYKYAMKPRK